MRINKSELSKKIGQLKGIVPSRTTIEALKGVLCSDGYLIASDTNLTVKAKLEGMEEETEPFIIPAKAFDFIGSLPDGELEVSVSKGNLVIKTGKIKNQFKTLGAELFAYTKSIDTDKEPAKIPALKLKKAIDHVIYAVAVSGSNQQMLGMYLECMDGKLNFVGLDGHRIAWDCIDYEGEFQIIVPRAAMENVKKMDFEGDVSIYHDGNGALFKSEEYEVYTRIIQGEYFKYKKMFMSGEMFTIIDRRVLMEAINRARLCGSAEDKAPVIMDMSGYIVKLDTLLTEMVNKSVLTDNKNLLENFKFMMEEPQETDIKISDLFKEYKKFVAGDMEVEGREIVIEDNAEYEAMDVHFEFEEEGERSWSSFKYATIDFTVDDKEQQDELNRTVRLSHWTGDRKAGWEIRTDTNPDIYSLRHMNKFDLLLAKLQRADARIIIDETADEDFVYSDTKPEPTYE